METGQFIPIWERLDWWACHDQIKELSHWFPGMHELIPSEKYYQIAVLKPFREEGWDIDGDGNAFETYNNADNLISMLDGRYASRPGNATLNFHQLPGQDDGSVAPNNISYYHIYGQQKNDRTIGQVVAKRDCILGGHVCFGTEYILPVPIAGDGTVPIVSANREGQTLNEPLHQLIRAAALSSSADSEVDHIGLCKNSAVFQTIKSILGGPNLTGQAPSIKASQESAQSDPAYYLRMIGNPSLTISDSAGNSGQISNVSAGADIPGVTTYIMGNDAFMVVFASDTTYTITFTATNQPLSIAITRGTSEATTDATRYLDLSLPAGVMVRIRLTSQGIENLMYDGNGDGTFETTVMPTAFVTGSAAQDTEAPAVTISENRQSQNVTAVTVTATDSGSGVKRINYSLDGTNYQTYSAPFSVDPYRVRKIYAFADDNVANRSGVFEFQLTAPQPLVFVEQGTTNRAVALDSVTFVRAPFPTLTNFNFSADRHTRVILFISGLLLTQSDSSIVTVTASAFPLQVEAVGTVTGVPGLNASYIVVRLPDGLPSGDVPLTIAVGGVPNSNSVTLAISP